MKDTVFVTLSDASYYQRALGTLQGLRQYGGWSGDIVLLCVDFRPDARLSEVSAEFVLLDHLDHAPLWEVWKAHPIRSVPDERHVKKTYQWDKLQVFGSWCRRWKRVVFLDAGASVLSSVEPLLQLEWRGAFLAPLDGAPQDCTRVFRTQLDLEANPLATSDLLQLFGEGILDAPYFLNCFFVFDTKLAAAAFANARAWMTRFPIMMCNEMGVMNLQFAMHAKTWHVLPNYHADGRPFLGYANTDFAGNPYRHEFCMLKY